MSKKEDKRRSSLLSRLFGGKKELSFMEEEKVQTPMRTIFQNFIQNKLAVIGIFIFSFIFLCCFILPIFLPLDKTFQDPTQQNIAPGFSFMAVPNQLKNNAKQIDGGSSFGAGIDQNGSLYLWGNLTGKLKELPAGMGPISHVSCGLDHIIALAEDGQIYTWGYDRLGLGRVPPDVQKANIVQLEAGYQISVALDDQGKMYVWGNENIVSITPREVQGNVEKFALNTTTALALTKDGNIVCLTSKETPFGRIPEEIAGQAIDVASTDKSAAAVTKDGRVYVWGSSDYGVMEIPKEIQGHVASITAGRGHFTVLLDDGTVTSWGWNNQGQSNAPSLSNVISVSSDYYQNYAIDANGKVSTWGLSGYLMGTDQYGRDLFTRLLSGGQVTMTIGAISVIIAAFIGIVIGGFSGYYGGKVDIILMRFGEIVNAIPFLPLAIILSYLIGGAIPETGRMVMIMVILGLLSWPGLASIVRAQILAQRENEFVTAAKAMGIKEIAIIFRHILPNVIGVVLVNLTLSFASCMLTESSLSFIGFGVVEPSPTWGNMLNSCMSSTVISDYWWRWLFPSITLGLSTISINLIGDSLRDAVDPKSNDR